MLILSSSQCSIFLGKLDVDYAQFPVQYLFFTCLMLILCKSQSTALCVDMFSVSYVQFPVQYLF